MVAEAKQSVREIGVDDAKTLLESKQSLLLVDVREDNEWEAGHLPGAVHIGRGVLEKGIEQHAPNEKTPIVVYCHSGARSALAAQTLQKMGYTNVSSMAGGIAAWQVKGFPVSK
jgi:rhodanese-related sulfurtransferase